MHKSFHLCPPYLHNGYKVIAKICILFEKAVSKKGYFAENFVAQEFRYSGIENICGWREGRAEVEFLKEENGEVFPIEVKSG